MIHEIARVVFSFLCHQDVGSSRPDAGIPAALCQRCMGMYAGAFLALFLFPLARFKPDNKILLVHGLFLFQGVLLGVFSFPQAGWIKILSGQLFVLGVFYILWMNIQIKRRLFKDQASPLRYFSALVCSLFIVQVIVHLPFPIAQSLMDILSLLGLVSIFLLSLVTIIALLTNPHPIKE